MCSLNDASGLRISRKNSFITAQAGFKLSAGRRKNLVCPHVNLWCAAFSVFSVSSSKQSFVLTNLP